MNGAESNLLEVYRRELESFLDGGGEPTLRAAYELGRRAITERVGAMTLIGMHRVAIQDLLPRAGGNGESTEAVAASWTFLMEVLSPYEMTSGAYRAAIDAVSVSEGRFRTLVESARDVIYTLGMDGTITSLNRVFEELTGWRREEWIGKRFIPLIHWRDLPKAAEAFRQVAAGGTPPPFELRVKTRAGTSLVGELIMSPDIRHGVVAGTFGIVRDVTQRKLDQQRLRELSRRVFAAHEEERRRLARDLHDDLCQWLSGMKLGMDLLERELGSAPAALRKMKKMKDDVNHRIIEVRRTSANLHPSTLDDFGLAVAVDRLCDEFRQRFRIEVNSRYRGLDGDRSPLEMETAIYRIAQEALSNAGKHSQASKVMLTLTRDARRFSLTVEDDGAGMDLADRAAARTAARTAARPGAPPAEGGMGLTTMRERCELLGGEFRIDSRPGDGTRISAIIPIPMGAS